MHLRAMTLNQPVNSQRAHPHLEFRINKELKDRSSQFSRIVVFEQKVLTLFSHRLAKGNDPQIHRLSCLAELGRTVPLRRPRLNCVGIFKAVWRRTHSRDCQVPAWMRALTRLRGLNHKGPSIHYALGERVHRHQANHGVRQLSQPSHSIRYDTPRYLGEVRIRGLVARRTRVLCTQEVTVWRKRPAR